MTEKIKFYNGEESIVIRENLQDKDNSIFSEQYAKAFRELDTFVKSKDFVDAKTPLNNIFAFIGDRGTGKTSCMTSVMEMYKQESYKKGLKLYNLEIIDPSFFDEKANILEIMLGKMFAQFSNDVCNQQQVRNALYNAKKNLLLECFTNTRNCISKVENVQLDEDARIDQLQELASSVNLQERVKELVDAYLSYFGADVLVLPIDDIDLNTTHAHVMIEQIRKYLIQKNIIVLMALKMEQLQSVMEKHYLEEYKELLDRKRFATADVLDMVTKYLTKLIPLNHHIYMPTVEDFSNKVLEIYKTRGDVTPVIQGSSVKYTVTALIFKKCRFLFYHSKGVTSPIVPNNLRDLRHLISMLMSLEDYRNSWDEYNKVLFKEYFFNTWVVNNMSTEYYDIVKPLKDMKDVSLLNITILKYLVPKFNLQTLQDTFPVSANIADSSLKALSYILTPLNMPYNVSIGDVFVFLDYAGRYAKDRGEKMLLFFIETVYSMRMYEYYDELTSAQIANHQDSIDETIRKRELLDGISNYDILVGGSMINTDSVQMLADEGATKMSRSKRAINIRQLRKNVDSLISIDGELDAAQQGLLHIVEFFALCVSRRYSSKNGNLNPFFRTQTDVSYLTTFGDNTEKVVFDLGAFFSNVSNVERAYNRVDNRLLDFAKSQQNSLYNRLSGAVIEERTPIDNTAWELRHSFLSWSLIRNAEILIDFIGYIRHNPNKESSSSKNTTTMAAFFAKVADYNIKTYDRDNGEPYAINFKYAEVISDALYHANEDEFNKVFAPGVIAVDLPSVMSRFDSSATYTLRAVKIKLSRNLNDFFSINPDMKSRLWSKFDGNSYTKPQIEEILSTFISENNLS